MPGISSLGKDNCKTRRETFKFRILVCLVLEIWQYVGKASYWCSQVPENLHIQCWRKKISHHCTLFGQGNECHTKLRTSKLGWSIISHCKIHLNRSVLSPEICARKPAYTMLTKKDQPSLYFIWTRKWMPHLWQNSGHRNWAGPLYVTVST